MKTINSNDRFGRQVLDFVLMAVAFAGTLEITGTPESSNVLLYFLILCSAWYISSRNTELYDDFRTNRYISEFITLIPNLLFQILTLICLQYITKNELLTRRESVIYIALLSMLMIIGKYLFKQYKLAKWSKGKDTRNILIVGNGEYARELHGLISGGKQFGYKLVGIINETPPKYVHEGYLGGLHKTEEVIVENEVDEMIICSSDANQATLTNLLDVSDKYAVKVRIIPEYFKFNSSRFKMDMFGTLPMVTVREVPLEQYASSLIKRGFDLSFSFLLFVFIFSWLFPLIALAIRLDSRGPVFFLQERWGKGGKVFRCYKFRTMRHKSSTVKGGTFYQTVKDDPRITRVGRFLRKSNLDELPQIINVILGEMSLVGPRPHAVRHSIETREKIPNYLLRHLVKPGITGWAQANGYRGETTNDFLMEKRVELDIWYVENWNFWLDVRIVLMTAYNMVKGDKNAY
ncbi:MAG: undecaprenyl-phosphate glucose phosphotransferase [Leadbetterella sp.]|nr:undecaprenyl-phosphate glucose phosphotransferase [Leadbetterella sp.]